MRTRAATAPGPETATGGSPATRWKLFVCLGVVVAALAWIAVRGLTGNFVYYLTPTDVAVEHEATVGQRIRLGGYVVEGSISRPHDKLTFDVSDGSQTMTVVSTGSVPEMFTDGQGVVLEGALGPDGRFHSDTLLIKHNGEYRPPEADEDAPDRADLAGGS
ncbi:MAG TPA: cytochrome c maturation protein CcmE [Nocardioidaceae bacterium]|nr:cytochrome c maturation protein CcmE [Nocardioidaceae bacterium]